MVTANMFLRVLFLSGVVAACDPQADLFMTAPEEMEALSGSCLQIPCSFSFSSKKNFDNTKETTGLWMKNSHRENVVFNSGEPAHLYPMEMIGNLREKNCTTLFSNLKTSYTDKYYFRVENSNSARATAVCDPLQITVKDSPWKPRIEISGDLKEKKSVTITCSAFTPCPHSPPQLTWTLQQDSHNNMEENTNGTFTTKIQEAVTLSDSHDGNNISCSARYPVNEGDFKTAETEVTLNVSYAPKDTSASISPSGLVSAGSSVNLTCSSRAKPPVSSFTWFKNSIDGPMKVSEGEIYSFNATDEGVYYCVATNDLGEQTSSIINLNIRVLPVGFLHEAPVYGGIIASILVICLVVCVCILIYWKRKTERNSTVPQSQSQTGAELTVRKTEEDEEAIHYGEIDFSKLRPEKSSESVQDSGQQQDLVYAQVRVSEPADSSVQTAEGPEELYAQVK
ncbi:sialic acid-binding Ig-like lectin 13 [Embiotoca jacksoni]|uniref:sialic acid-binding Ig-like lectin 13 n=1 Tax=Embiotoca jacksoni TaxID=100190 RepID=UPI0037046CF0